MNRKRCKHKTGYFSEIVEGIHSRLVSDGMIEDIGSNSEGSIIFYSFDCAECGKYWRSTPLNVSKMPKFFQKMHDDFQKTF